MNLLVVLAVLVASVQSFAVVIGHPQLPGDQVLFTSTSTGQGICKSLGYEIYVDHSKVTDSNPYIDLVEVSSEGKIIGGDNGATSDFVSQIECDNKTSMPKYKMATVVNPIHPQTQTAYSKSSDVNAICKLNGYDLGLNGAGAITEVSLSQPMVTLNSDGIIVDNPPDKYNHRKVILRVVCVSF